MPSYNPQSPQIQKGINQCQASIMAAAKKAIESGDDGMFVSFVRGRDDLPRAEVSFLSKQPQSERQYARG